MTRLRNRRKNAKRRTKKRTTNGPVLQCERLEDRKLMTSTVYLDFGLGFPDGALNTSVDDVKDGLPTTLAFGPDLGTLQATNGLTFQPLAYDFDHNGSIDEGDTTALQQKVMPIVQRAFAPFDVDTKLASASSIDDVWATLRQNGSIHSVDDSAELHGVLDAYVFVTTVSSGPESGRVSIMDNQHAGNGNPKLPSHIFGQAPSVGFSSNDTDKMAIVFADEVHRHVNGTQFSTQFNETLATAIAQVATHEALHTFHSVHTLSDDGTAAITDDELLSQGDQVRKDADFHFLAKNNIITRFDLLLQDEPNKRRNNYEQLRDDQDIGLRDTDRDGVPDFAYVTGTGAHDQIELSAGAVDAEGRQRINVEVRAFRDPARTNLIGSPETYSIIVGLDTEGSIRIDASVGDDLVIIDEAISIDTLVYGGDGNDTIRGGGGSDRIHGENGNDVLLGRGGADVIGGGQGDDRIEGGDGDDRLGESFGTNTLLGGDGDDSLWGGHGIDDIRGGAGNDRIFGNGGHDVLRGGDGDDDLRGGPGQDSLQGEIGKDTLRGGPDQDTLNGGLDTDIIHDPNYADIVEPVDPDDYIVAFNRGVATAEVAAAATNFMPVTGMMMAADLPNVSGSLDETQATALAAGLQQVLDWLATQDLKMPVGGDVAGSVLHDALDRGFADQVIRYLNEAAGSPTIEGVGDVLANLGLVSNSGLEITATNIDSFKDGDGIGWQLHFTGKGNRPITLDHLGAGDQGVRAPPPSRLWPRWRSQRTWRSRLALMKTTSSLCIFLMVG